MSNAPIFQAKWSRLGWEEARKVGESSHRCTWSEGGGKRGVPNANMSKDCVKVVLKWTKIVELVWTESTKIVEDTGDFEVQYRILIA